MKQINVALVEDSNEDFVNCQNLIHRYEKEKDILINLVRFSNAEEFLFEEKTYPIIILDINLGGLNGMDLARKIREKDELAVIMFVTNLAKYACNGYEVDAMDFVLKPLSYPPFSIKLDKAIKIASSRSKKELFVQSDTSMLKIDVNDILYVEVQGHSVFIHMTDSTIPTSGSLREYEGRLSQYGFLKCNNCFLVNLSRVSGVKKYDCVLDTGEVIAISHPKRKSFMDGLMDHVGKVGR